MGNARVCTNNGCRLAHVGNSLEGGRTRVGHRLLTRLADTKANGPHLPAAGPVVRY